VEAALRGFEELPPQLATGAEVLMLVQEDRLVAKSEEAVFQWIKRWWEAAKRPEAELLAVMKHVRFAAMAEAFLRETVGTWPALRCAEGKEMLLNAALPTVDGTKVVPRWGFGPRVIYVVGGTGEGGMLSTVELYNPQNASWKQLAKMESKRSAHGCVALNGKLYVVGGRPAARCALASAAVYDPQTDGWQPLAKMSTRRCSFGLATAGARAGGKIYAIGGYDDGAVLESVEAYDPQLGSWALVASMSGKRKNHASVVLDGKIYTMGGLGGDDGALDTVEVYDPQADSWRQVASMPQALYQHAAAAMGGKIYVTGGCNEGDSDVSSVFVYDPQADTWMQLASMSKVRRAHASTVTDGKLYVFGGLTSKYAYIVQDTRLYTVEVYDPASDSWAHGPTLTTSRSSFVAVTL